MTMTFVVITLALMVTPMTHAADPSLTAGPGAIAGEGVPPAPDSRAIVWDNDMTYVGLLTAQIETEIVSEPADDFIFDVDQPVNDVHWIGGYWSGPPDDGDFDWQITFYDDDGGTMPGLAIASWVFPNSAVNETFIESFYYSYSVDLPTTMTFLAGQKYWISIQGIGPNPPQSGWGYHEVPIILHEASFRSVYFGFPDWTDVSLALGYPVDMCFQLTYEEDCNWEPGDPHKMHYPQLPDTTGWDVNATWPVVLADDWRCTETGWIKDVHFWGSWRDGIQGYIQQFSLSIHEDIPAGTACIDTTWATGDCNGDGIPLSVADLSYLIQYLFSGGAPPNPLWDSDLNGDCVVDSLDAAVYNDYFIYGLSVFDPYGGYPVPACCDTVDYSMPGQKIWGTEIFNWDETAFDPGTLEGWYDPATGDVRWDNHTEYFQYNICLDSNYWFWQNLGDIYWLNITAMVEEPGTMWGWKSTQDHFNDDAVWDFQEVTPWQELYEPGTGETWDTLYNAYGVVLDNEGWLAEWYADDHYGEGFYYYDWYGWWNVWFYDHPYDPDRYKTGRVELLYVDAADGGGPFYFEIAVNWSTDIWSLEFPEQGPPLPPTEEDMFIGRQILFATDNPIYEPIVLEYEIPDYNPEWVSIDVRGYNFINEGILVHECRPKLVTGQSLDLAFVITGEFPEDSSCCRFRGDINHDGAMGGVPLIDDLVYLTTFMFQNGPCGAMCDDNPTVGCNSSAVGDLSEADVNGDGSPMPLIDDLVYLTTYMFQNGPEPVGWIDYYTPACINR